MKRLTHTISWLFGILVFCIGVVNTGWGNDPFFGVFIMLLSFVFFPPVENSVKRWTGLALPGWLKFLLAAFIIWAALGVGELLDKIDMMVEDFL